MIILIKYRLLIFVIIPLIIATYANASTYLDVGDEVYDILHRLEAEGVIQTGLLSTKPLSRKEVIRLVSEAEQYSGSVSAFIQSLIQKLKDQFRDEVDAAKYVKPLDEVTATYIHADNEPSELSYNNDGDDYDEGSNYRLGMSSRAELGWFSFYMNPEVRYSDSDTDLMMKKVYGVLDAWGWELQVGTDSQWWGPGYHGAILLSNNPEPLTLVKLTNSRPVILPWIFEPLGLFKFTTFVTRLEKERIVPEPYLWGMRFNLKPSPKLELGFHRTAIFGGEGYPEDVSTWWDVFRGEGEDDPNVPGDQRAGGDIKLTLPFDKQPVQLYMEANGEDEANRLPSNWAYLYGVYFPRVFDFERIELRAEFSNNHISGKPNVWYNHGIYRPGYTFKSRIIGHHMGTDSEDMFIKASYIIPERNGRICLAYDRKEHNLSDDVREKKEEVYLTANMDLTKSLEINTSYGFGKIKNFDNISGNDENMDTFIIQLNYDF